VDCLEGELNTNWGLFEKFATNVNTIWLFVRKLVEQILIFVLIDRMKKFLRSWIEIQDIFK
jgi:hypothetical protein